MEQPTTPPAPAFDLRSFTVRLWLTAIVLNLALMGLVTWALLQSRQHIEQGASVTTDNLARVMEHDIQASIRLIDLTLQTVASEAARLPAGGVDDRALNQLIEQQRARARAGWLAAQQCRWRDDTWHGC